MEIYLIKDKNNLLKPVYESDQDSLRKIPANEEVKADIVRPRNYQFHKKFFALLNLAFNNQERYDNFEAMRAVFIMKAGFYEEVRTDKGLLYFPKSISFANMDEIEFTQLYSKMLDIVCIELGAEREDLIPEIENFM